MAANDDVCVDFIRCLADLNLYIVVETIVQHAGYEATVNMLCVSKVVTSLVQYFLMSSSIQRVLPLFCRRGTMS